MVLKELGDFSEVPINGSPTVKKKLSLEDFTNIWNAASNSDEVVKKTGMTYGSARHKATHAKRKGYSLKFLPGTDGEKQYNLRTSGVKKRKYVKTPKPVKVPVKREPVLRHTQEQATGCDNAYFAGVFDLQGHIELMGGDRKTYAMIRIATTHKVILESIQGVYGGEIRQSGHPDQGGASYLLTWPEHEDAHKFLEAIAPYVRRLQPQVSALRNWLEFQVLKRYEEEVILEVLRKTVIK